MAPLFYYDFIHIFSTLMQEKHIDSLNLTTIYTNKVEVSV